MKRLICPADESRAIAELKAGEMVTIGRPIKLRSIDWRIVAITSPKETAIELKPGEFNAGVFHYLSTGGLSGPYRHPYPAGTEVWGGGDVERCRRARLDCQ